jgi:hypothetical protein
LAVSEYVCIFAIVKQYLWKSMTRQIRKKSGTGIYHIMLRGINRQDIFEDNEDYKQMTLLFIPTKIKTCKV